MDRRALLRAAAMSAAASVVLPAHATAAELWARLAATGSKALGSAGAGTLLASAQAELLTALADTIIPRTDSPGAVDVGVPAFVELIVAEYDGAEARRLFGEGLTAIDALATATAGANFAALSGAARDPVMQVLEAPDDRTTAAARAYSRLKGLVVHGYFTSAPVQRDVLGVRVFPGRFDGAAPHVVRVGGRNG